VGNPVEKVLDRMHYDELTLEDVTEDEFCSCAAEADDHCRDCNAAAFELLKNIAHRAAAKCPVFDKNHRTTGNSFCQIVELFDEWLEAGTRAVPYQLAVRVEQPVDVKQKTFAFRIRVSDLLACAEDSLSTEVGDATFYLLPDFPAKLAHFDRVD